MGDRTYHTTRTKISSKARPQLLHLFLFASQPRVMLNN